MDDSQGAGLDKLATNSAIANQILSRIAQNIANALPRTIGTFTLAAAATTTVPQPAVQANSMILFFPTNGPAATLMGSAKSLYPSAVSPGVSFTVATANAVAAAGTETFTYLLVNPA